MPQLDTVSILNTSLTNDALNLFTKRHFIYIQFAYQIRIDGNRFFKNVPRFTDKR